MEKQETPTIVLNDNLTLIIMVFLFVVLIGIMFYFMNQSFNQPLFP